MKPSLRVLHSLFFKLVPSFNVNLEFWKGKKSDSLSLSGFISNDLSFREEFTKDFKTSYIV